MKSILLSEFKTHCVGLLHEVEESHEELVVTQKGKPIARVLPAKPIQSGKRLANDCSDSASIQGDIVQNDLAQDWENL